MGETPMSRGLWRSPGPDLWRVGERQVVELRLDLLAEEQLVGEVHQRSPVLEVLLVLSFAEMDGDLVAGAEPVVDLLGRCVRDLRTLGIGPQVAERLDAQQRSR